MNNLRFLHHALLFSIDESLPYSTLYPSYLPIYQFFPTPPGVEYFLSRNIHIDLHGPWQLEPSSYPMPAATPISFADAADDFGYKVVQDIEAGKQVYLMWSGGIDSTCVAVSVLKHLYPKHYDNFYVVLSDASKHEHPMFYNKFLSKFNQIEVAQFDPVDLDLHNSLILDGEGGDQSFGSSAANKLFSIYPEKIMQPWRNETDFLYSRWHSDRVPTFYEQFMGLMHQTIDQGTAPVETLYDFYWWLNFNFKFDSVMYRHSLRLGENLADEDFEYFCTTVMRRFFVHDKVQQWSMTAGAPDKINQARKTVKWAGRKYIYDFDHNEYYFREKRKEFSTSTIAKIGSKWLAVDKNYKRYTIADRAVRLSLRDKFYPNYTGKIEFFGEMGKTKSRKVDNNHK